MAKLIATLNPNDMKLNSGTLSNGNLTFSPTIAQANIRATHGKSKGKWYWEVKLDSGENGVLIGVANKSYPINSSILAGTSGDALNIRGYIAGYKEPENVVFGSPIVIGDVVGVALDIDENRLEFYRNGVSMGVSHSNLNDLGELYPFISTNSALSRSVSVNFGASAFKFMAPNGYKPFNTNGEERVLIFNANKYFKYNKTIMKFLEVGSTLTETLILDANTPEEISLIPESTWSQLIGNVELCYYTDDLKKIETQFNIETTPFTLAEEWEDKTIKIIEYTDDPSKTESKITLETEPFSLYDELGDSVDVLYYTDDPTKTKAELGVTTNYSPLDEINGDFEVVTWTNEVPISEDEVVSRTLEIKALPFAQLILTPNDIKSYGNIKSFVASKIDQMAEGTLRFIASFDSGVTWKTNRFGKWKPIAADDLDNIKKKGMSLTTINSLSAASLIGVNRIGYYIDNSKHHVEDVKLDYLKVISNAPVNDVKFNDLAFYLLNTTATIQLSLQGNKLIGRLDDADTGRVQYRVSLNNKPYYPANGEFTVLAPSPLNISFNISERDIIFDQENTLKVEFQDYWGLTDFWQTTFIGTYSGIMFKDESGKFYSNSFGEVLKHLDFGDLIAGQSTLEQKVIVKNQLGVKVQNLLLEVMKDKLPEGVKIELSRSNFPFIPEDPLLFNMFFNENEEFVFYVRIVTELKAPASPNGQFEIRAKADSV